MFSSLYGFSVLLNLVVFFREAELQPKFTAEPSDPFAVLEGNNITLEWSYDLASASFKRAEFTDVTSSPTIRILEVVTFGQTLDDLHRDYTGRVQVNVTTTYTSITILGANRTVDSKEYEFEVVLRDGINLAPSVVTVSVQYDPEFTSVSDDQVVVESGPGITLECIAIGEPPPNITWTRELDNGSDSNVLFTGEQFVLDNNRTSIGTYRCTAYNGIGTAPNRTVAVHVNYKPENFQFVASETKVCQDRVINFTCSADGNPAVHTHQLFENDTLVPDGSNSHGIRNRTMSTGGVFIYKCVANNTAGTGQSESVTVTVNGEQDIS